MRNSNKLSSEATALLQEIIAHESESDYWRQRFEGLSNREDVMLRGSFKELRELDMVSVRWADNYPYFLQVLRDGYRYEQEHPKEETVASVLPQSPFEAKLHDLIKQSELLKLPPKNASMQELNDFPNKQEVWLNDAEIFCKRYLSEHPLNSQITTQLFHRSHNAVGKVSAALVSISNDAEFINRMNGSDYPMSTPAKTNAVHFPEYDVFLSHASKDKVSYVNKLNKSLKKLGVNIFYDTDVIGWGDNWKSVILEGTEKAEFAIIVISENFFGREWTEKELNEFLNRQNQSGQKIILPILYDISSKQLAEQYPELGEIQALHSDKYTTDEIALLFARELIKRLKEQ